MIQDFTKRLYEETLPVQPLNIVGGTDSCQSDNIVDILIARYAEEVLQWYIYEIYTTFAIGKERHGLVSELKAMADDELDDHSRKLLKRISELCGGSMDTRLPVDGNLSKLMTLARCEFVQPASADTMDVIAANITNEMNAINGYKELCVRAKDCLDETTLLIAQEILRDEEEHLQTLLDFMADIEQQNSTEMKDKYINDGCGAATPQTTPNDMVLPMEGESVDECVHKICPMCGNDTYNMLPVKRILRSMKIQHCPSQSTCIRGQRLYGNEEGWERCKEPRQLLLKLRADNVERFEAELDAQKIKFKKSDERFPWIIYIFA